MHIEALKGGNKRYVSLTSSWCKIEKRWEDTIYIMLDDHALQFPAETEYRITALEMVLTGQ